MISKPSNGARQNYGGLKVVGHSKISLGLKPSQGSGFKKISKYDILSI